MAILTGTAEPLPEEEEPKDRYVPPPSWAAVAGSKGGKARAAKLTPEERKKIARKAAEARWRRKK